MKGRAYIYDTERGLVRRDYTLPVNLRQLQEAVGGYIESVPLWNLYELADEARVVSCVAYCNEDGKLKSLPLNPAATDAWDMSLRWVKMASGAEMYPYGLMSTSGLPSDYLVGNVIVIVGDTEFMRDHIVGDEDEDDPDPEWWPYGDEFIPMEE